MDYNIPSVKDAGSLRGKRVILRLNLNVPVVDGKIGDDLRIRRGLPTLHYLAGQGACTLIVSHIDNAETKTLEQVYELLRGHIPVSFAKNFEEAERKLSALSEGEFVLLENLRTWEGEKANDPDFAKKIASLGEMYVNDDFAVSHRVHASVVSVPRLLPSYAGFEFMDELKGLSEAFHPKHPFLFILGGAKFETKAPLIQKFLDVADHVFIGGTLANEFFHLRGFETGQSALFPGTVNIAEMNHSKKLILPTDVLVLNNGAVSIKKPEAVLADDRIVDAGPETLRKLGTLLQGIKFVLWNGPLGEYEHGFPHGTEALAQSIASSTADSIVGGGDTVAVVDRLGLGGAFGFVSTAGGASLDFLANETLPGIEALRK